MGKKNLGCHLGEIEELERFYDLRLPQSYRRWLSEFGREPSGKLVGSDYHYPVLLELKDWAEELLNECGAPFVLGREDFVFLMHQGYQFFYFKADGESDDPPIYQYYECGESRRLSQTAFPNGCVAQAAPNNDMQRMRRSRCISSSISRARG